jgi:hypothetical protein
LKALAGLDALACKIAATAWSTAGRSMRRVVDDAQGETRRPAAKAGLVTCLAAVVAFALLVGGWASELTGADLLLASAAAGRRSRGRW